MKRMVPKRTITAPGLLQFKKESKSERNRPKTNIKINREEISEFTLIGIFDKKIIVTFHNRLQLFGYFDLHAIHERIRYEYYSWKTKKI